MIEDTMFDNDCYAVFMEEEHEKEKRVRDNISRQAALDEAYEIIIDGQKFKVVQVETLMGLPSAELEPKTGKWIRHDEVRNVYGGTYVECSECGEKYVVQHIEDEKYCRNCGADMRGGDNEAD